MISGIVLAAGAARRLGRQKLFLNLKGKPVLRWVLEAALNSKLDEVVCVVRRPKEVRRRISVEHEKLRWILNEKADEGQSTSVIVGLEAVSPQCEGALFLVGDQPLVKTELINGLMEVSRRSGALIVAPSFDGQSRNPVLFRRELFPELLKLSGDRGGKSLIVRHKEKSLLLAREDEESFLDLDTWEDYERLKGLA